MRFVSDGRRRASCATLALAVAVLASTGCRVAEVREQAAAVDATGRIAGTVATAAGETGGVVVVLFRKAGQPMYSVHGATIAGVDGRFAFTVPPAEYFVAAFLDRNGDARYEAGEPGRFYGEPTVVSVPAAGDVSVTLDVSDASGQFASGEVAFETTSAAVRNIGRVTTLDDPRFAAENGPLGLWRPLDFLEGPGAGLFMLGEYDAGRMPVVFVHGIGGTPRDFSAAIAGLDRGRYQPWVLSYPSGVRLDMVSDYLVTALRGLHGRHGFRRFAVVAHSMGGLVTRSFVQKLVERHPDTAGALRLVVTVNSPMLGMASAASGVEHSPIVVPVWQDVATGSEFVARLAAARWPAQVPYHLVFSYSDGDSGDGTVPLDSQIPIELQALATRIHGFKGTHTGTLSNPEFLSLLSELLASVGPVQAAPGP